MKISKELRKAINAGVRRVVRGANPLAEVGLRDSSGGRPWTPNGLNWVENNDLGDLVRLAYLKEIDDCPDLPNCATLDLYVTTGTRWHRELETNVYVTIKDGKLVDIHSDDRNANKRTMAILGRPFSKE